MTVTAEVQVAEKVLTDKTIDVLVAAALPRTLRIAEKDRDTGSDGESSVFGHFVALVPGQSATQRVRKGEDARGVGVGDQIGAFALEQGDQQQEPT